MTKFATLVMFLWVSLLIGGEYYGNFNWKNNIAYLNFKRSFEFTSRLIILVLFTHTFKIMVMIPITLRWLLGTTWIITLSCSYHQGKIAEFLFQIIMGFVNVFLFFNLKDGPSKYIVSIYYIITFLEGKLKISIYFKFALLENASILTWPNVTTPSWMFRECL